MARKKTTYNRTNKNMMTSSAQRQRANAAIDGRAGRNSSYTSGARTVNTTIDNAQGMREAWNKNANPVRTRGANGRFNGTDNGQVQTVTSSVRGRMSTNGRTAGGRTWTMTAKDNEGNTLRQSGRSQIASRSQRYYDVIQGLNNVQGTMARAMNGVGGGSRGMGISVG